MAVVAIKTPLVKSSRSDDRFDRVLGLGHLTASGIGVIIGAGIYVLLGPATAEAGALVWASFLVAGLLSALTALSYMELASMFPKAGAEYEFARQVFPRWVSFTAGWAMSLALVVAASAVSLGFARYAQLFVVVDVRIVATLLVLFVGLIAMSGMKRASWLVIVLSAVQVGGLILVIALGANHVGDVSLIRGGSFSGVVGGSALIFFAFIGFDEVITLSEETRDPHRTVPRALMLSLAISTMLYVAVAIVAVSVLGHESLSASTQPLTDVVRESIGGGAVNVVAAVALLTTMNTTLLLITAASRMTYSMASSGDLPSWFARLHHRSSPRHALIVCCVLSVLLLMLGDIHALAAATDALIYLMFVLVNFVVIVLRRRRPLEERPFKVPLSMFGVPILPIFGILVTIVMASRLRPSSIGIAAILTLAGLVMYAGVGLRRR